MDLQLLSLLSYAKPLEDGDWSCLLREHFKAGTSICLWSIISIQQHPTTHIPLRTGTPTSVCKIIHVESRSCIPSTMFTQYGKKPTPNSPACVEPEPQRPRPFSIIMLPSRQGRAFLLGPTSSAIRTAKATLPRPSLGVNLPKHTRYCISTICLH